MTKSGIFLYSAIFTLVFANNLLAFKKLDDKALRKISAQGSVQIEIDNMHITADLGITSYTDNDGTNNGKSATVVVTHGRTEQSFNAILDESDREGLLSAAYGDLGILGDHAIKSVEDTKSLTIGIEDELPLLSAINRFLKSDTSNSSTNAVQGIQVSLPTIEMKSSGGSHHMRFQQEGAINNNKEFSVHEISGQRITAILGGRVEIAGR